MATIDVSAFESQLKKLFKDKTEEVLNSFSDSDKTKIGDAAIVEMKTLISKGVSPIAENGRFDAYKWVGISNQAKKIAKSLTGAKKRAAKKIADQKLNKYPYSVQGKFPNKKERPVNLFLSGAFLSDLVSRPIPKGVEIGFATALSEKKEQGHREGVNGQPPRPIIPQGGESLSSSIYRRIVDTVALVLRQKFRT